MGHASAGINNSRDRVYHGNFWRFPLRCDACGRASSRNDISGRSVAISFVMSSQVYLGISDKTRVKTSKDLPGSSRNRRRAIFLEINYSTVTPIGDPIILTPSIDSLSTVGTRIYRGNEFLFLSIKSVYFYEII